MTRDVKFFCGLGRLVFIESAPSMLLMSIDRPQMAGRLVCDVLLDTLAHHSEYINPLLWSL